MCAAEVSWSVHDLCPVWFSPYLMESNAWEYHPIFTSVPSMSISYVIYALIYYINIQWSCEHIMVYHVMQDDDDGWEEFSEDVDDINQLLAPASAFPGELLMWSCLCDDVIVECRLWYLWWWPWWRWSV